MSRLVRDLTDIGQSDAGRFAIERTPQNVTALTREVADALTPAADQRGTRLEVDIKGEVPPIDADGDRVVQVLSNLVTNAIKVGAAQVPVSLGVGRTLTPTAVASGLKRRLASAVGSFSRCHAKLIGRAWPRSARIANGRREHSQKVRVADVGVCILHVELAVDGTRAKKIHVHLSIPMGCKPVCDPFGRWMAGADHEQRFAP